MSLYSRYLLLGCLPLLLSGCSSAPETPSQPQESVENALTRPDEALFRGTLQRKGDEATFTPCDSKQSWSFVAEPAFWQRWQELGNPQKLYAEVEGKLELGADRGSPINLKLRQVDHLAPQADSCHRDTNFAFRAFGHDPEWNLTLQGESGLFSRPDGSSTYQIKKSEQADNGQQILSLESLEGEEATLTFTPALCQEQQANQIWGYSVTLEQGDTKLQGCGERGRAIASVLPPLKWYGVSAEMKAQVGLVLTPEHLATFTYYRDAGPKVVYNGVWQPTANGLDLLLNQRNELGAREVYPFTRDGDTLTASYQLINGAKAYLDQPLKLQPGTPALPVAPQDQASAHGSGSETPTQAAFTPVVLRAGSQIDSAIEQTLLDYFAINKSDPKGVQYRFLTYDLNDDHYPDAIVQMNWCQSNGCTWLIFQGSLDGYRFLSRMEGVEGPLYVAPQSSHGWHDLLVQSGFGQWNKLAFDGVTYPIGTTGTPVVEAPASNSHSELRFDGGPWLNLPDPALKNTQ